MKFSVFISQLCERRYVWCVCCLSAILRLIFTCFYFFFCSSAFKLRIEWDQSAEWLCLQLSLMLSLFCLICFCFLFDVPFSFWVVWLAFHSFVCNFHCCYCCCCCWRLCRWRCYVVLATLSTCISLSLPLSLSLSVLFIATFSIKKQNTHEPAARSYISFKWAYLRMTSFQFFVLKIERKNKPTTTALYLFFLFWDGWKVYWIIVNVFQSFYFCCRIRRHWNGRIWEIPTVWSILHAPILQAN